MRIGKFSLLTCLLAGSMLCNSCIGSFSMFNKLASWNTRATGNKFLNELIGIVISPAYAVCLVIDSFVLNTIEFWSGDNPMAMKTGKTEKVMGTDGKIYAVKYLKDGYEIKRPDGKLVTLYTTKK